MGVMGGWEVVMGARLLTVVTSVVRIKHPQPAGGRWVRCPMTHPKCLAVVKKPARPARTLVCRSADLLEFPRPQ